MHSTRIIVFFLAAFKIVLCLNNNHSLNYVNWYITYFCEVLANGKIPARVSKVPLAQRASVLQPPRALLPKIVRSPTPPLICTLQLQLPRALPLKTARSRSPPVICNLQLYLQPVRAPLLKIARSRLLPVCNLHLHL
jgi:hypothetical protein